MQLQSRKHIWGVVSTCGVVLSGFMLMGGCGGGQGGTTTGPVIPGSGPVAPAPLQGGATITIEWPARPDRSNPNSAQPRLVPKAANTILIEILQSGRIVDKKLALRPASGSVSTVSFEKLPASDLTIRATAFPGSGAATGTPQATGTAPITTEAGKTARVTVTMNTTIARLAISPARPAVQVGIDRAITLTATAYDARNRVVLLWPLNIRWISANSNIASVSPGSGVLQGNSAGTTTVTVTEAESGKTATATVTVTTGQPTPQPSSSPTATPTSTARPTPTATTRPTPTATTNPTPTSVPTATPRPTPVGCTPGGVFYDPTTPCGKAGGLQSCDDPSVCIAPEAAVGQKRVSITH